LSIKGGLLLWIFVASLFVGCSSTGPDFLLEYEGTYGIVRLSEDSFGFAVYSCDDAMVSRLQLSVLHVNDDAEEVVDTTILTLTFDPPVSSRQVLVSTDPSFTPTDGVSREVTDPAALARFNSDPTFLVSTSFDSFLGVDAWDENGEHLKPGGGFLQKRFEAEPGEIALPGFVGPVSSPKCRDGSQAWR
jgi:hypothetical protein